MNIKNNQKNKNYQNIFGSKNLQKIQNFPGKQKTKKINFFKTKMHKTQAKQTNKK